MIEIHKVLKRQLARTHLMLEECPHDLDAWQEFLQKVSTAYTEFDEERYLLDRSIHVSSRELTDLYEKLQHAQETAQLGYWDYETDLGRMTWSRELRNMVGLSATAPAPTYHDFIKAVLPDYQQTVKSCFDSIANTGDKHEVEVPIKIMDGSIHWYYIVGVALKNGDKPYKQLSGIAMDITKRKNSEDKLKELNAQVIANAREVGMADVAVSILHNVGNVLNSVNVSSSLVEESLRKSHCGKFFELSQLIAQHKDNLADYITNDPRGKLIPQYIETLAQSMKHDFEVIGAEVANISEKIQHIRDIVVAQQSLSRVNGIFERVQLRDLLNSTLSMIGNTTTDNKIRIEKEVDPLPEIYVDRSKLVQILVNLIQNAKDSLLEDQAPNKLDKFIKISIKPSDVEDDKIIISVKDNGLGISKDNMQKIFNYKFSTKSKGHGIGLHSSSLTAKEMGGNLTVFSDGVGQGAEFRLEIPQVVNNPGDQNGTSK